MFGGKILPVGTTAPFHACLLLASTCSMICFLQLLRCSQGIKANKTWNTCFPRCWDVARAHGYPLRPSLNITQSHAKKKRLQPQTHIRCKKIGWWISRISLTSSDLPSMHYTILSPVVNGWAAPCTQATSVLCTVTLPVNDVVSCYFTTELAT